MIKVICEYDIPNEPEPVIEMLLGSRVLSVAVQHGRMVLWAVVDAEETVTGPRRFRVYGVGQVMDGKEDRFVGTAVIEPDDLTRSAHVFEVA